MAGSATACDSAASCAVACTRKAASASWRTICSACCPASTNTVSMTSRAAPSTRPCVLRRAGRKACAKRASGGERWRDIRKESAASLLSEAIQAHMLQSKWILTCGARGSVIPARAGMRLVVDLGEVLPVEMSVDLGGADAGVPKHFLNGAQVARRLQHMGGKCVAQQVRVDVLAQAGLSCPAVEPQLHAAGRQAGAAPVDEQGGGVGLRQGLPLRQPGGNGGQGLLPDRHGGGIVALG